MSTIAEFARSLEFPVLPDEYECCHRDDDRMLECPANSPCGRTMKLAIRQYAHIYHKAKRDGAWRAMELIAKAAWAHCSLYFYG